MKIKTITIIIITIILGVLLGSTIYFISNSNKVEDNFKIDNQKIKETDVKELKVGPNTKIILNTIYQKCGHEKEEILETKEYINMDYSDIENKIEKEKKEDEVL